jgi:hypothetical protein
MIYDPVETETFRKLACRHCNREKLPNCEKNSTVLLNMAHGNLHEEITSIENCGALVDDVSFFCEECNRTSVFSFGYHRRIHTQAAEKLLFDSRIKFRASSSLVGYSEIIAYYLHLVVKFRDQHEFD